jgi:hypothetical protein
MSSSTKVIYFLMALDPVPLTWLESLSNNSIDSWEGLKKVFIDNFQGVITRAGTHHDLAQCKQERNKLLRSYTRRFFDVRATIANISEEDIIDCFYNGLTDPGIYRVFGRNRRKTIIGLRDMMHDWSEQEEKMRERFSRHNNTTQGAQMTTYRQEPAGLLGFTPKAQARRPRRSCGSSSTRQEDNDAGAIQKALAEKMPMASRCQSCGNQLLQPQEDIQQSQQ